MQGKKPKKAKKKKRIKSYNGGVSKKCVLAKNIQSFEIFVLVIFLVGVTVMSRMKLFKGNY